MLDQEQSAGSQTSRVWTMEVTLQDLPLRSGQYEIWCDLFDTTGVVRLTEWMKIGDLELDGPIGEGIRSASEMLVGGPLIVAHSWTTSASDR